MLSSAQKLEYKTIINCNELPKGYYQKVICNRVIK